VSFLDDNTLITGGEDGLVSIWAANLGKDSDLKCIRTLRGHRNAVNHVAVSRAFSIIVSCGNDGKCIIWDLNRFSYVKELAHCISNTASGVVINEITGDILIYTKDKLALYDVNGTQISNTCVSRDIGEITCVKFYEGKQNQTFSTEYVVSGHSTGILGIWKLDYIQSEKSYKWDFELVHVLMQDDGVSITAVFLAERYILAADYKGRVFSWILPDGSGTELHFTYADSCQQCLVKFTVLDRKSNCKACGKTICGNCTITKSAIKACPKCIEKVCDQSLRKMH
jgi:WD40 repeat protein